MHIKISSYNIRQSKKIKTFSVLTFLKKKEGGGPFFSHPSLPAGLSFKMAALFFNMAVSFLFFLIYQLDSAYNINLIRAKMQFFPLHFRKRIVFDLQCFFFKRKEVAASNKRDSGGDAKHVFFSLRLKPYYKYTWIVWASHAVWGQRNSAFNPHILCKK